MSDQTEPATTDQGAQGAPIVYDRQARAMGLYTRDFYRALVAEGVDDNAATPLVEHWVRECIGNGWGPPAPDNGVCAGVPPLWGVPQLAATPLLAGWHDADEGEDGAVMMRTVAATIGAFARALKEDNGGPRDDAYLPADYRAHLVLAYFDNLVVQWRRVAAASRAVGQHTQRDGIFGLARAQRAERAAD